MKNILTFLSIFILGALAAGSCIEDGFSTSPSDLPVYSVDTLDMGVIFTGEPSPTSRFKVYNPHSKSLLISKVRVAGDNAGCYRVNVDGISGTEFDNVEIRGRDSLFVLVEATLPSNDSNGPVAVDARMEFTANGVTTGVVLRATGQNVRRISDYTVSADEVIDATLPCQVFDSIVVAEGATLTLRPGAVLYFHDKASLIVRGTLVSEGSAEAPVHMTGDRRGNVVGDISFDIMSRQWRGVTFASTSTGNSLQYTDIRNTEHGVRLDDGASLSMLDCRLHNSAGHVLEAEHAAVEAVGCEFAEGGAGLVRLCGGRHSFRHCTFANNYLFAAITGPAITLEHLSSDEKNGADDGSGKPYMEARISNSVIYGIGADITPGDLGYTSVQVHRCLLSSKGSDDSHFTACLWDTDPLYYTERENYVFDYRLRPGSPAIGAADPAESAPADFYGRQRGAAPDMGAYVFVEPDSAGSDR